MKVTEVRIDVLDHTPDHDDRLHAFCSITLDDMFVVHDLRIIEGSRGFFVAMPSRKLADRCGSCGGRNPLRNRFCGHCGGALDEHRSAAEPARPAGSSRRDPHHVDVAHPINPACRELIEEAVLAAYADVVARRILPADGPEDAIESNSAPAAIALPDLTSATASEPPPARGPLAGRLRHRRAG